MARVEVRVPGALRSYCGGKSSVEVQAASVREVLAEVGALFPGILRSVCDETGAIRTHVNVFLDQDNVRHMQGLATSIEKDSVLHILPAISGGSKLG